MHSQMQPHVRAPAQRSTSAFIRRRRRLNPQEQCVIHDMASPVDYRRLAQHQRGLYFVTPDRRAAVRARAVARCSRPYYSTFHAFTHNTCARLGHQPTQPTHSFATPRDEQLYEAFLEAGGGVHQPAEDTVQVAMGRTLHVPDALGAPGPVLCFGAQIFRTGRHHAALLLKSPGSRRRGAAPSRLKIPSHMHRRSPPPQGARRCLSSPSSATARWQRRTTSPSHTSVLRARPFVLKAAVLLP